MRKSCLVLVILIFIVSACTRPINEEQPLLSLDVESQSAGSGVGDEEITAGSAHQPDANNPCSGALIPFDVGNQWVYEQSHSNQDAISTMTWTVIDANEEGVVMNVQNRFPELNVSGDYTFTCEDGNILYFPSWTISSAVSGDGINGVVDIVTKYQSGSYFPSVKTLEEHHWQYAWETELLLSFTISGTSQEPPLSFEGILLTRAWSTAGNFEELSIPGDHFTDALKIERTDTMILPMDGAYETQSNATEWYAFDVGLLKSVHESIGQTITTQLVSFTRGDA